MIIPKENEKDLEDIPPVVKKKVNFYPVSSMDEVLELVFVKDTEEKKPRLKKAKAAQ
ncbi:MAG: hypothetical protein LLG43_14700 [Deltaproteobacteria bacterium]|nr:hypothetical protein [Deltaproteobacteria bacterium]